jgi:hypothetical protein
MAKLNLNFQKSERHNPTGDEIAQIEYVANGVVAIIKALGWYAQDAQDDRYEGVLMTALGTLELLMEPITEYFSEYAGKEPAEEEEEKTE